MAQLIENPYYTPTPELGDTPGNFIMGGAGVLLPTNPLPSVIKEQTTPAAERRLGDWGTISKPFYSITDSAYGAGLENQRVQMSTDQYYSELRSLEADRKEFDNRLNQLSTLKQRLDPVATEKLATLNRRYSGLHKAASDGKLNQLEVFRATAMLGNDMKSFDWESHLKGKGAVVGDIYEDQGVIYQNQAGKGPVQISYTPDYIKQNTFSDPNGRYVIVPIAPGHPPKIMSSSEWRDSANEERRVTTMERDLTKEIDRLRQMPQFFRLGTEELAKIALRTLEERRGAVVRSLHKAEGTEHLLSPQQQKITVEEEMGMRPLFKEGVIISKAEEKKAATMQPINRAKDAAKSLGFSIGDLKKAEQLGYSEEVIATILSAMNYLKHKYPNAKKIEDLPEEYRDMFREGLKIARLLKGK